MLSVPLRAVIFDWDGTLLDSYRADARAYLGMFAAMGIPWGLDELAQHYSPDWHNVYRAASLPRERWAEADEIWRRFYRSERPALQPGARHVLHRMARRYRLALVTSGSGWRVRSQLRLFALHDLFEVRVYGDNAPRRKPHPAPLRLALRRIGCEPAACVYVGDAPEDVQMARRAGVRRGRHRALARAGATAARASRPADSDHRGSAGIAQDSIAGAGQAGRLAVQTWGRIGHRGNRRRNRGRA